jgi:carbamoyl-phosphate synthase large subunit
VQFAVSPDEKEDIVAIEINPRVSRSSALASKATGYPIAKIASKLALGYNLMNCKTKLPNQLRLIRTDRLCNCKKYHVGTLINLKELTELGLQMKSVGEVMGIGRSFQEALATQSLEIKEMV